MNSDELLTKFRSDVALPDEATTRGVYTRATHAPPPRLTQRRLVLATALVVTVGTAAVFAGGLLNRTPSPSWIGRHLERQFVAYVARAAKRDPGPQFARAHRATILRILQHNAGRFAYRIKRVQVLPGRDGAPLIVVRFDGSSLPTFSRSIPTIERLLDPLSRTPRLSIDHMKYEAFFFEAVDSRNVPFVVIWNVWRQPVGGGGQWAREDDLYPFGHL